MADVHVARVVSGILMQSCRGVLVVVGVRNEHRNVNGLSVHGTLKSLRPQGVVGPAGGSAARAALERRANDPDPSVRDAVTYALERLAT
jgi:hypothetical protein